jgi:hypothetical protein
MTDEVGNMRTEATLVAALALLNLLTDAERWTVDGRVAGVPAVPAMGKGKKIKGKKPGAKHVCKHAVFSIRLPIITITCQDPRGTTELN